MLGGRVQKGGVNHPPKTPKQKIRPPAQKPKNEALFFLESLGRKIRDEDNRCTAHPVFCVQAKIRDLGIQPECADGTIWLEIESGDYTEVPEGTPGAVETGYRYRWETRMVSLTEEGCEDYIRLNGHNDRYSAHNGELRIFAHSFYRCEEMIQLREALKTLAGQGKGDV